jgi:AraC-like DNA-binding protein
MPAYELSDQFVDAGGFWKQKGDELVEQLTESPGFEERVSRLNLFFLGQLDTQEKDTSLWSHVMDQLFYDQEEARIYKLAKKMKITPRHFRRVFQEVSGITPKHFQQLSRFHAVLKELLVHRDTNYLPVALDKGYFDQTHFIKEFKRFMGITPSVFLTDANFMSHFYYPSF